MLAKQNWTTEQQITQTVDEHYKKDQHESSTHNKIEKQGRQNKSSYKLLCTGKSIWRK